MAQSMIKYSTPVQREIAARPSYEEYRISFSMTGEIVTNEETTKTFDDELNWEDLGNVRHKTPFVKTSFAVSQ